MTAGERAAHFWRWMWLGFAVGVIYAALTPSYPWSAGEEALAHNLGSAMASGIMGALLARGACWLWLRRTSR